MFNSFVELSKWGAVFAPTVVWSRTFCRCTGYKPQSFLECMHNSKTSNIRFHTFEVCIQPALVSHSCVAKCCWMSDYYGSLLPVWLSNARCRPAGPDTAVPVPAAAPVCVNGNQAMTSGSGNNAPTVTGSTPHNGHSKTPQAIVKPQILTHVIEGFVIQEGAEPFPVSASL